MVAFVGVLIFAMRSEKSKTPSYSDTEAPQFIDDETGVSMVSDSSKETLKTLIARTKQNERAREEQDKLIRAQNKQIEQLKTQLENQTAENPNGTNNEAFSKLQATLTAEITDLKSKLSEIESSGSLSDPFSIDNIPVVIDEPEGESDNSAIPSLIQPDSNGTTDLPIITVDNSTSQREEIIWLEADDAVVTTDRDGKTEVTYPVSFENTDTASASVSSESTGEISQAANRAEDNIPMYTIPANSTLLRAVGMTAIIGRVPMAGTLQNPFRFKVLLGQKNLASNGLKIPNLESMVLSGTASGDFTMECAQGVLDTATFTFRDGTVRVMESSDDKGLGWISDQYGTPCIAGQYISNFMSYVATVGSLSTISSIAEAIAQSNVSTVTEGSGIASAVTGNTLQYGVGQGINDGAQEIIKWFADRQESAFDAVFLPVGQKLTVHIEETLEIDYEKNGRKLVYEENLEKYL